MRENRSLTTWRYNFKGVFGRRLKFGPCLINGQRTKFKNALRTTHRNLHINEEIPQHLVDQGFHKTAHQCRTKVKSLKAEYYTFKAKQGRSGVAGEHMKFYDQLNQVLEHTPETVPPRVAHSLPAEDNPPKRTRNINDGM